MINGIINVYKEKGFTSHDVVAKLRGILKQKKIGHTGTLDPDAEGVLPVCLGKATKVCDLLTNKDKTYRAQMLLGIQTDTQDTTGVILSQKEVMASEKMVKSAVESFVGEYDQIPPMYSALKVNGKKLYELAREGIEVERKARRVRIYSINIIDIKLPVVTMEVTCSKGTYIRTLCHDIGQKLGCGGCMQKLLRTRVSSFKLEESHKLEEIQRITDEGHIGDIVCSVDSLFSEYKEVCVKKMYQKLVYNGNPIGLSQCEGGQTPEENPVRIYDSEHRFIGIYEWSKEKKRYAPVKIFWETIS